MPILNKQCGTVSLKVGLLYDSIRWLSWIVNKLIVNNRFLFYFEITHLLNGFRFYFCPLISVSSLYPLSVCVWALDLGLWPCLLRAPFVVLLLLLTCVWPLLHWSKLWLQTFTVSAVWSLLLSPLSVQVIEDVRSSHLWQDLIRDLCYEIVQWIPGILHT